jgi:hypothetical protein
MPDYRIYTLTVHERVKKPPRVIECADDQEAVEWAKRFVVGADVEVWDGARMVVRLLNLLAVASAKAELPYRP